MCHTYVVISENTLQEMLSDPHEFVSEVGDCRMLRAVKMQNTFSVV
jgi:hypothetical protein